MNERYEHEMQMDESIGAGERSVATRLTAEAEAARRRPRAGFRARVMRAVGTAGVGPASGRVGDRGRALPRAWLAAACLLLASFVVAIAMIGTPRPAGEPAGTHAIDTAAPDEAAPAGPASMVLRLAHLTDDLSAWHVDPMLNEARVLVDDGLALRQAIVTRLPMRGRVIEEESDQPHRP